MTDGVALTLEDCSRFPVGQPHQLVTVEYGGRIIADVKTNDAGYFKVRVQRGGVYLLRVGHATCAARVWMHNSAVDMLSWK